MAVSSATTKGRLIAIMGDEDTCVGFLLGGIGELNKARQPNFMVVDKNTSVHEIEDCFRTFVSRSDIAIVMINQHVADQVDLSTFPEYLGKVLNFPDSLRGRQPHQEHSGRAGDPIQGPPLRPGQGLDFAPGARHVQPRGIPLIFFSLTTRDVDIYLGFYLCCIIILTFD